MAGGMGLLCMTDMAVAADHVVFGLPEVKVGVFPMQVLSLLQSIAPPRLVAEWALTGEPLDARAAQAAGLRPIVCIGETLAEREAGKTLDVCFRQLDAFSEIIAHIEGGRIDTRPWITHRTDFTGLIDRFPSYTKPETGVIKAVVEVQ